jgi:hypothetical protein
MAFDDLRPGLRHAPAITVREALTVPAVSVAFASFADMPPVFATAFIVGFVRYCDRPRDRSTSDVGPLRRFNPGAANGWNRRDSAIAQS